MMRLLLGLLAVVLMMHGIVCPPLQPPEGDSPEEDLSLGVEYERYLREIVTTLEDDESFRKKLEEMNMTDIKNGKIARHLELVDHQIREKLDEIKRQEIQRLRKLTKDRMKSRNGMQVLANIALSGGGGAHGPDFTNHVEVRNPHSFEEKDLELLIKKATRDLDAIDKKRRGEFKEYEMEKEYERQEELKKLDEEHRKMKEEEYDRMKKRHEDHPKIHHPGSKDQLEEVWQKKDHMDAENFDPKTFFKMHDLNEDDMLDQEEVEALFQQELDQVYDPNLPEDDMRERYEEMARMREHVFGELDKDKDKMISIEEFLNYTATQEFQQDEGWKTVDEQPQYTDEEYQRYEQMMAEYEQKMKQAGYDPNMVQPGMVPLGNQPQMEMQIPEGMHQGQMPPGGQMPPQGQMPMHGQMPQGQMPPGGQMPMHGQMPPQGQMPMQGQMPQQGQMPMHGQMPPGGQMPPHGQMGQMPGGQPMGQGMPPGQMPGGQGNIHIGQAGDEVPKHIKDAQAPVQAQAQGGNVQQGHGQNDPKGQGHGIDIKLDQGNVQQNLVQPKQDNVVDSKNGGTEVKVEPVVQGSQQVQGQGSQQGQGENVAQQPPHGQSAGKPEGQAQGGAQMGQGLPVAQVQGQGQPLKFESQQQHQQQQQEEKHEQKPLV